MDVTPGASAPATTPGEALGDALGLRVGVLGPVAAWQGDAEVKVGGAKARGVLAMLALDAGQVVSTGRLIDGLWGDDPPDGAMATLQVHVSNLRKAIGADLVVTRAPGYVLAVSSASTDLGAFDADVASARASSATGDLAAARQAYASALDRWRGPALDDVAAAPFAAAAVPWLEERRDLAVEEQLEVELGLGRHRGLQRSDRLTVAAAPHRERRWGQLMVALYRSGRQADALAAFQRARTLLADDLGIDPGPELRRLEAQVLAQDAALDLAAPAGVDPEGRPPAVDDPGETIRARMQTNCRLLVDDAREVPLDGPLVVGRHPECGLCLADASVSRRHAELRPAAGGYLLVDLGSANGTLVNDAPVVNHLLVDGDLVRIGGHRLAYRSDPAG